MTKADDIHDQLTPQQTDDLLNWVIDETRGMLAKFLRENFNLQRHRFHLPRPQNKYFTRREDVPINSPDFEKSSLKNFCGPAQIFMKSVLEDRGYAPKSFSIHALGLGRTDKTDTTHVGVTIDFETTAGTKRYLLDPTFKQFCTGEANSPVALLANLPDGEHMVKNLLDKGFVELTPVSAASYLTAFCRGVCPFDSKAAVEDFFSNPKDERSLLPVEKSWPPKSFFVKNGWLPGSVPKMGNI